MNSLRKVIGTAERLRFVNSDSAPLHGFLFLQLNLPGPILRYDVPLSVGCGGGGATGLYSTAGLVGLLNGLIAVFFGFFFSRLRLSRLPINFSS
jgi:hypothetical protein